MNVTEIAVIGAGPAGVAAAVTAAEAGARVMLIDENPRAGGAYYKQPASASDARPLRVPASLAENIQHGRELIAGLKNANIDFRSNTLVWNITSDRPCGIFNVLDLYAPEGGSRLQAKRVIIASGAYERVAPFAGWTLPGVTTVGAAQVMLKGQGVLSGERLVLAGTGPLLQVAAVQLLEAGAQIAAIVELQSRSEFFRRGLKLFGQWDKLGQGVAQQKRLLEAGVPFKYGYTVARALGDPLTGAGVAGAVIAQVDANGRMRSGSEEQIAADTICLNYGFVPATELTRLAGCAQHFDSNFGGVATTTNDDLETSVRGIFAAGEVRGIGGVEVALLEGRLAGAAAARQLGYSARRNGHDLQREWRKSLDRDLRQRAEFEAVGAMFTLKPGLFDNVADDVIVCRCEEISAGAIREAARAGVAHLNSLKAYNRCGMGHCQGRICGPSAAQIIANETGASLESVGVFTARVPIKPVPLDIVGAVQAARPTAMAMEDHAD